VAFFKQKDKIYIVVTLIVFIILIYSLTGITP
jgi:uncharacterized membrane protein